MKRGDLLSLAEKAESWLLEVPQDALTLDGRFLISQRVRGAYLALAVISNEIDDLRNRGFK